MRPAFTDNGLEAMFFDSVDALQACVEERDIRGAILRLENMHSIVLALDATPTTNIVQSLYVDGSAA